MRTTGTPQPYSPAPGIHQFVLDNEMVVFSEANQQLYHLNSTAAFIWLAHQDGCAVEAIVGELTELFGITDTLANQDVRTTIGEWSRLGLLGQKTAGEAPVCSDTETSPAPQDTGGLNGAVPGGLSGHCYCLLDSTFLVRCGSDRLSALIHPVLAHAECPHCRQADLTLEVTERDGLYLIAENGRVIATCRDECEIAPYIHARVLAGTYSLAENLFALHAAVVCQDNHCVLMPGESGSGKSTLTAALASRGFAYGTDELALVMPTLQHVRAVPMSIGLKAGSWPVLGEYYPELKRLPVYTRADGNTIRYLSPGKDNLAGAATDAAGIKLIVFPRYDSSTQTVVEPLSAARAVCRFTAAGYDVPGGLTVERVAQILEWVQLTASFELRFSRIDEAISAIRKLLL